MNRKNKGGRPRLTKETQRSVRITVRFTEDEADGLIVEALREGVPVAEHLRQRLLAAKNLTR